MKHLKIGIVEDELLIAESIAVTLRNIGYQPTLPARSYDAAIRMIEADAPDLLLVDISLDGEQDGIELAMKVNQDYGIPFIFLTALSDAATVNRAKQANPFAYLVKPFNEHDLFSAIEIAFNNFNQQVKNSDSQSLQNKIIPNALFIKEGGLFHKVTIENILYVESENVYLNIYTPEKKYTSRIKLDDFINDFANENFCRIHRSYAVNILHLETIKNVHVVVAGKELPLNKLYKNVLMQRIKAIK